MYFPFPNHKLMFVTCKCVYKRRKEKILKNSLYKKYFNYQVGICICMRYFRISILLKSLFFLFQKAI